MQKATTRPGMSQLSAVTIVTVTMPVAMVMPEQMMASFVVVAATRKTADVKVRTATSG